MWLIKFIIKLVFYLFKKGVTIQVDSLKVYVYTHTITIYIYIYEYIHNKTFAKHMDFLFYF